MSQRRNSEYVAFGSIEGALEAVNLHGSPVFTIWDRVTGVPVRCYFPPKDRKWAEIVKQFLERDVMVRGQVNYFKNGLPKSITSIQAITDATAVPNLPKATFGSLSKDRPDNIVEFLGQIRTGT